MTTIQSCALQLVGFIVVSAIGIAVLGVIVDVIVARH